MADQSKRAEIAATRKENGELETILARMEHHSGPLPHPDTLARYGQIDPQLPMRIVNNAEEETKHRRALQTKWMESEIADNEDGRRAFTRGQYLGTLVAALILATTAYAIHSHETSIGLAAVGTALIMVVRTFITKKPPEKGTEENTVPQKIPEKPSRPRTQK